MTYEPQDPSILTESLGTPPLPLPVPNGMAAIVVTRAIGAQTLTFRRVRGSGYVDIYDDKADLNVRHTLQSLIVGLDIGVPVTDPQTQLEVIAQTYSFGYEQRGVVDNLLANRVLNEQREQHMPRTPEPEAPDLEQSPLANQGLTGAGVVNEVMASRSEEALEAARAEIAEDEA